MKIGLISDTHIQRPEQELPSQVFSLFADAGLIIHAGDLVTLRVAEELSRLARTETVRGNMDLEECRALPTKRIVEAGGLTIGVFHGEGGPRGIVERVLARFNGDRVRVIVFGHSHRPMIEQRGDLLLVNPGSPTDDRFAAYHSVGFLEIEDGKASARIVRI